MIKSNGRFNSAWRSLILMALFMVLLYSRGHSEPEAAIKLNSTPDNANNNTRGYVPGNAAISMQNMRQIYQVINIYRARHAGQYPMDIVELLQDLRLHPIEFGFTSFNDVRKTFTSPDTRYGDSAWNVPSPDAIWIYQIRGQRLDGSSLISPKLLGTHDVLATTDIYLHSNIQNVAASGQTELNPVGFCLVLWDNGEVQKIPYDRIIYAFDHKKGHFTPAFYSQAGISSDFITYQEYWNNLIGLTRLPIGKPVPDGQTAPVPDNGAPEALIAMSRLLNKPIDREAMWQVIEPSQTAFTLHNVQDDALKLGLPLNIAQLSFDELKHRHQAAILHVRNPDRLVTVSTIGTDHSIIYDAGTVRVVDNATLTNRFAGEALIASSVDSTLNIQIDDPVRVLEVPLKNPDIEQIVTFTNHSNQTIKLAVEQPVCGCVKADLSSDHIESGAAGSLHLVLHWRDALRGNIQYDILNLYSNDTLQPCLQLAFVLKRTISANSKKPM